MIFLVATFTGCFGGVETTSRKYKKEFLEKVFVKSDEKAKAKYNKIIAELEKVADEGNEKAEKELDLWDDAKFDLIGDKIKAMSPENERIVFRGFGSFEVRETTERLIVDPKDSSNIIHAKPRKYIKFKISKNLQDSLCLEEK